ncbi:MAG: XdhC/CoxI family protein [Chloroflexi bacterium]|nr:MAG: XdhC/CoxI family protein [Chloroflexota bacterium]
MRDILAAVDTWQTRGDSVAVATVIKTWGSSPRAVGAKMAVNSRGEMAGSVSGGCVESAVVEESLRVLKSGRPRLLQYGVADDTAWSVGLACGGSIEIFVESLAGQSGLFSELGRCIKQEQPAVAAVVIRGPAAWVGLRALFAESGEATGPLLSAPWGDSVRRDAAALLAANRSAVRRYSTGSQPDDIEVFFEVHRPPPKLVIVGGVHIAVHLIDFARALGFATILIDPRTAFANPARFPHADRIVNRWPDEALADIQLNRETSVVLLTHDPKLDDPALKIVLPGAAGYVGALGSAQTHARRVARLQAEGVTAEQLARLHAPIGLNIGGRSPAEIALSIMAQIVAVQNQNAPDSKEGSQKKRSPK